MLAANKTAKNNGLASLFPIDEDISSGSRRYCRHGITNFLKTEKIISLLNILDNILLSLYTIYSEYILHYIK